MRAFLAATLLFTSLLSCSGELSLCKQKFSDTSSVQNGKLVLPISTDEELIFSETVLHPPYKKTDSFLGLYLRDSKKPFLYPFAMTAQKSKTVGAIDELVALPGKLSRQQIGLNVLGQFDQPLSSPGILSDPCCNLEGIITQNGVIEKAYIRRFLSVDEVRYGDAGIRLLQEGGDVVISSVDPFMPDNPFQVSDLIKTHNGKSVRSAGGMMASILFAAPGEKHTFGVKRAGKELLLYVVLGERHGGGLISDTYLEGQGLFFENKLTLKALSNKAKHLGLCQGDRLIRVNGKAVSTWRDVRQHIGSKTKKAILLFERDAFHFFIHLPYIDSNS